nr:upstream activation factor subunit UAF30-like isoform X3 [Ipomoea batatas]
MRLVFETDCTDMFKMNKLLAKHITRLEPSEPTVQILQNTKRIKTDEETGSRTDESVQIVIISEALANFFGTSEREMSQAEVLRQVWEYIKVNQLEVSCQVIVIRYVILKICFFS